MNPYAQQAAVYRLALIEKLVEPTEVIAWAETQLAAAEEYDDDLANLALVSPVTARNVVNALTPLAKGVDPWAVLYGIIGKLHDTLSAHPERGLEFTLFLMQKAIDLSPAGIPEELDFIYSIDMEFGLAEEGIEGTFESATQHLLERLKKFKDKA